MEITFGWIYMIIFVSSRLPYSVSGLKIRTGTFQILKQHPQLKKCTESFLFEDEYVGFRVSEHTGQCEGFTRTWGLDKIIEQGYGYAKKLSVEETFQLPLTLTGIFGKNKVHMKIPVVIETGTQIDILMAIPDWYLNPDDRVFAELLIGDFYEEEDVERATRVSFWIGKKSSYFMESVHYETTYYETTYDIFDVISISRLSALVNPKEMFKISFKAQPNAIVLFIEDEEIATLPITIPIHRLKSFGANLQLYEKLADVIVYDIKFTGVLE